MPLSFKSTKASPNSEVVYHTHELINKFDIDYLIKEAQDLWAKFLSVPSSHEIIFRSGGASKFMANLQNILENIPIEYLSGGIFAQRALELNKCSSKLIENISDSLDCDTFVHFCLNQSEKGTKVQIPNYPNLITDATSFLGASPIDIEKIKIIYASLQKFIGFLSNATIIISDTNLNVEKIITPDIAPQIASAVSTAQYLIREYSNIDGIGSFTSEKAYTFYNFLDQSELFIPKVENDRSETTIVFELKDRTLTETFFQFMKYEKGITDLSGHKAVGDCRVGFFNFISMDNVKSLISAMKDFERRIKSSPKTICY